MSPSETVRLDKWLLAARVFKTRPVAQDACDAGAVTVNEHAAAPARPVRVGDLVDAKTGGGRRLLKVIALGERRGTAEAACLLFEDLTPPEPPSEEPLALRDRGAGRPTKRDRRDIGRMRGW
jgi:ribosome-associated heat shock protein Hsp15